MTRTITEPLAAGAVPGWTLGWRLKRALAYADLGTEEIAQELGVVRATISRWTNDRGAPPRPIYLRQLALRTGVSYEWLKSGDAGETDLSAAAGVTTERDADAAVATLRADAENSR